jgi:hypothetical protein
MEVHMKRCMTLAALLILVANLAGCTVYAVEQPRPVATYYYYGAPPAYGYYGYSYGYPRGRYWH